MRGETFLKKSFPPHPLPKTFMSWRLRRRSHTDALTSHC